jgi:V8-like Glu-specific endopeptidase
VMIKSARGTHCTGVVLARDIVLTAAHCTSEGTELTVSRSADAGVGGNRVIAVVTHPQYDAWSYAERVNDCETVQC